MAKIKEWENNVTLLSLEKLKSIKEALETLNDWEMFDSEFGWTGYYNPLYSIVSVELKTRK